MCQRTERLDVHGDFRGRHRSVVDEQIGGAAEGDGFRSPRCLFRLFVSALAQGWWHASDGGAATASGDERLN